MHKMLKLQHHRHTAKQLPHHHTSYRGLFLIALSLGLAVTAIQHSTAATIDVLAQVNAPVPSQVAAISTPAPNSTVNQSLTDFTGNCEVLNPTYTITVWRDDVLLGSTICKPDGTFSLPIQLVEGVNNIRTGTINISSNSGPDSPVVVIYYALPKATPPVAKEPDATPVQPVVDVPAAERPIVLLQETMTRLIFTPDKPVMLSFEIKQGDAPYKMTIDWGDGIIENSSVDAQGRQDIEHTYRDAGTYRVVIKVTDKNQRSYQVVLAAQTFARHQTAAAYAAATSAPDVKFAKVFPMVWTAYGVTIAVIGAFGILELTPLGGPPPIKGKLKH